jgi:hypothetical protein
VNLRYNPQERRFEAEFSDFQADLDAVKTAGFKTTGAPYWVWWTDKLKVLNKLRERPPAILTITPEALAVYKPLAEQDRKNAEIKKLAAEAQKTVKKASRGCSWLPAGKDYLETSDLPPMPPFEKSFQPPPPPDVLCSSCQQPVYFYELQGVFPLCLWCEKNFENKA